MNWEEFQNTKHQEEEVDENYDFGDDENNLVFYWLDAYER